MVTFPHMPFMCFLTVVHQEVQEALVLDGMDHVAFQTSDLRTTKALFVKTFVELYEKKEAGAQYEAMGLVTRSEKYKQGVNAWMNSHLRGALMSGKGQGHAAIPASLLMSG